MGRWLLLSLTWHLHLHVHLHRTSTWPDMPTIRSGGDTEGIRLVRAVLHVSMVESAPRSWLSRLAGRKRPPAEAEVEQPSGYYQNLGISAPTRERTEELIDSYVGDGLVLWKEVEYFSLTREAADALLAGKPPLDVEALEERRPGIWYASGRLFY
jgi:hypothetical protein